MGTSSIDWAQLSRLLPNTAVLEIFVIKHRLIDNAQDVSNCDNISLSQTSDLL
jgi:hypothetical protein